MAEEVDESDVYEIDVPNFVKAKKLCRRQYTCLHVEQRREEILLPYRFLTDVHKGVTAMLKEKNLIYCHRLGGVVIAFGNVRLLQDRAKIVDELPVLVVTVQVEYVIFRPTLGSMLVGVVTRIGADYFGMLVHKCINASIQLKKKKLIGLQLQIGKQITFVVKNVYTEDGLLSIGGKLNQSHKAGNVHNKGANQDMQKSTLNLNHPVATSNVDAGNAHSKGANQDIKKSPVDIKRSIATSNDDVVRGSKRKLKKKKDKKNDVAKKKAKLDRSA